MYKLILCTALALLTATTASVQAKDKKSDKDKDRDNDRRETSERDSSRYRDDDRYRSDDRDRGDDRYRGSDRNSDRSRTIYVIERERPVQRVVYVDSDGRYYQRVNGQRVYLRQRYYETYPSRYYTPTGQRRLSIRLPF